MANVLIQLKRGKQETWEKQNPTLAYGEPGYEKETGKLKIGNGITAWNELPYLTNGGEGENAFKQSDWNQNDENASDYIKNRTHYVSPNKDYFHITQEMIENPLDSFVALETDHFYKVSDMVLEDALVDNLIGTTVTERNEDGEETVLVINENNIYDGRPDDDMAICLNGNNYEIIIVLEDYDYGDIDDDGNTKTVTSGIWIYMYDDTLPIVDIETPSESVTRLDEKYLPKSIVGKNVQGKSFTIDDEEIIAQDGAEIFNNYLYNIATGYYSHAEGYETTASGDYSHAEGNKTTASGHYSHVEGSSTTALGQNSHAEGYNTKAGIYKQDENGNYLDSNGNITTNESEYVIFGEYSHAEGYDTTALGTYSHAEGRKTKAVNNSSHAEGYNTIAAGGYSHAEGSSSHASGNYSHAEGNSTTASGLSSHAEGDNTTASGYYSHAEGWSTTAKGSSSHAEGSNTKAIGNNSHAEGYDTQAGGYKQDENGSYLDKDGNITTDVNKYVKIGKYSHAEGNSTTASGECSHAEGNSTTASGECSHAEGNSTTASGDFQHVQGKYNIADETSAFIIGNGESEYNRSNAMTVDWDGNAQFAGAVEANRIILKSSTSDKRFVITVDDNGTLTATELTEE